MFSISDLPLINASLNAVSTVFISLGWFFIRRNIWQRHVPCMIAAIISSTLFLIGYIVYHVHAGEKSSGYTGWMATVYFPILASHVCWLRHAPACDRNDRSGVSAALGPTSPPRALDDADLALRVRHRCDRLPFSLPMVPAGKMIKGLISKLALHRELMFDQVDSSTSANDLW